MSELWSLTKHIQLSRPHCLGDVNGGSPRRHIHPCVLDLTPPHSCYTTGSSYTYDGVHGVSEYNANTSGQVVTFGNVRAGE